MIIKVVAAFIEKDGKVLIAKRATGDKSVLGKWEFPGGKVKDNESAEEAIEREINEEFEIKVKAKKIITSNVCRYPNKTVDLKLYECDYVDGIIKLHDHFEYLWIDKNKLLEYDLAKADISLACYVINKK